MAGESAEAFLFRSLNDATDRGTWLVLSGDTGCGKTHLAKRVRDLFSSSLIDAHSAGRIARRNHLPCAVFARWDVASRFEDQEWEDWTERLLRPAIMVIIDDIGAEGDEFKSGKPCQRLKTVLDVCESKWLLLTTNVEPGAWADRFGVRVADRLMQARRVSLFGVESWRMKK